MPKLYDALKASYETNEQAKQRLVKDNFVLVKDLSSHNQKVFYNPITKKLLLTIAGTHNLHDVGTDVYLALGKIKDTNRYKEAKDVLEKAKKYFPNAKSIDIAGHSLGAKLSSELKADKITTYNKGATFGDKINKNEKSYRTEGDVVSTLASNQITLPRQTKNLRGQDNHPTVPTFFKSHNLENLRDSQIKVAENPSYKEPIKFENPQHTHEHQFINYNDSQKLKIQNRII